MDRIHMDALDAIAGAQAEAFITLADGNRYGADAESNAQAC